MEMPKPDEAIILFHADQQLHGRPYFVLDLVTGVALN